MLKIHGDILHSKGKITTTTVLYSRHKLVVGGRTIAVNMDQTIRSLGCNVKILAFIL